jgi:hypothetical protein
MATRTTTRRRTRGRGTRRRTPDASRQVAVAAARAVERVLSSSEALGLLVRRLEAAGWHIERDHDVASTRLELPVSLTPPARAR